MVEAALDVQDRAILNRLQSGFPICERPFEVAARELGLEEGELIARLQRLLRDGVLTRFGPLYQIERVGGVFVLAAMEVASDDVDRVGEIVNGYEEVAHNYLRAHRLNLWFVVAAAGQREVDQTLARIEADTGYPVHAMRKLKEYFLDLRLPV